MNFFFKPEMFLESLKYMGIGMVGIFAVIGSIILVTLLLGKVSAKKA